MNAIFRTSLIAALALATVPLAARAQDTAQAPPATIQIFTAPADRQPSDEQLKKLFDVMRLRDQMASMTSSLTGLMQQQSKQQIDELQKQHPELANMTEEQKQQLGQAMGRFMQRIMTVYTGDDVIADMKEVYRHHLTRDDVDALIAIYQAPAGQHMLAMAPAIMQEYMPSMMHKLQDRMKPILADLDKELAAIGKQGAAQPEKK